MEKITPIFLMLSLLLNLGTSIGYFMSKQYPLSFVFGCYALSYIGFLWQVFTTGK